MTAPGSSHHRQPAKPTKLKPDPGKHYHCRIQTSEDDIPRIEIDIHGDASYYLDKLSQLQKREILIAPFMLLLPGCCVHVTPLGVPFPKETKPKSDSKGKVKGKGKGKGKGKAKVEAKGKEEPEGYKIVSSFHIIQLFSSRNASYLVDLLISDENLYFLAFRRHVVVLNDNEKRRGTKLGPGNWYTFMNEMNSLPDFIDATPINMLSGYSRPEYIKQGGDAEALREIFVQLIQFESSLEVTKDFRRAMYSIMLLYCESRRSREMQREMSRRIEHGERPSKLSKLLGKTIHMWKSFSGMVIQPMVDGTIKAGLALKGITGDVLPERFKTIADLIGVDFGELLIAKLNVCDLMMTESELKAEEQRARVPGYVKDHPFPVVVKVPEGKAPDA